MCLWTPLANTRQLYKFPQEMTFRNLTKKETSTKYASIRALSAAWFMLLSCLAYFYDLKMEATCSSETSVNFQQTWHYITEDRTISQNVEIFPTFQQTSQLSSGLKIVRGVRRFP
jgi:hypothetical protein